MNMRIREGDFVLITDVDDKFYLQIGEVIDVNYDYYSHDFESASVRFAYDKSHPIEYGYDFSEKCSVVVFERH